MPLKFLEDGYDWQLRAGFPPMGSTEIDRPRFEDAIRDCVPSLSKDPTHDLSSWVVARLTYLTSGALEVEGTEFSHDTNELGYKLRAKNRMSGASAHGAIVIAADRVTFAFVDGGIGDFQAVVVEMLARYLDELGTCSIRVREPESGRSRVYGWDGYSLHR